LYCYPQPLQDSSNSEPVKNSSQGVQPTPPEELTSPISKKKFSDPDNVVVAELDTGDFAEWLHAKGYSVKVCENFKG